MKDAVREHPRSPVHPELIDENRVALRNEDGFEQYRYGGLYVWDAFHRTQTAWFEIVEGNIEIHIENDADAVGPLTIDPLLYQYYIIAGSGGSEYGQLSRPATSMPMAERRAARLDDRVFRHEPGPFPRPATATRLAVQDAVPCSAAPRPASSTSAPNASSKSARRARASATLAAVRVFFGNASGTIDSTADFTVSSSGRFGAALAVGDFKNDRYGDFAVGAPAFTNGETEKGRVHVRSGEW